MLIPYCCYREHGPDDRTSGEVYLFVLNAALFECTRLSLEYSRSPPCHTARASTHPWAACAARYLRCTARPSWVRSEMSAEAAAAAGAVVAAVAAVAVLVMVVVVTLVVVMVVVVVTLVVVMVMVMVVLVVVVVVVVDAEWWLL